VKIRGLIISADARLDGRSELINKLSLKQSATDAELILYAYEAWGEDCVKHLIGDFAFAIHDSNSRRLFCARDHFGVKPFFYAGLANDFIFSTNLNELRQDPRVSNTLNEIAIGDYLLFGVNQDLSTTTFKDIQRLPPAHSLTFADGSIKIRCYWTPSIQNEVRFGKPNNYVERFSELFSTAIEDRLRTDRVAISMSGGLDSTSIAAIARTQLRDDSALQAFTVVYDKLIPDEERYYSTAAATHLAIPITHLAADDYSLFDEQVPGDMDQAEPFRLSPYTAQFNSLLRLCAAHGRVALTGYDGDAFMNEPGRRHFGIRSKLKRLFGKYGAEIVLPEWIDESFAERTQLLDRWKQSWSSRVDLASPANPVWTALFESYDRRATRLNLEVRHPFIDVRLVEFLSAIPARPWCVNKNILRLAMKDKLPPAVVDRPKTPLAGNPALQLVRHGSVRWLDSFEVSPQLRDFVNFKLRPRVAGEQTSDGLWANLRIYALNYWLTNSQPIVRRATTNEVNNNRACMTSAA